MASIKLTSISPDKNVANTLNQKYLYKDLFLDLENRVYYNTPIAKQHNLNDVQALYDVNAIKSSITNIFLTSPGQKVLNPEFGIDLRRFLFEPITESNAYFIRTDITRNLPRQEPRIIVTGVSVIANIDDQQYDITLQIDIPQLNVTGLSIRGNLNSNGYTIV